MIQWRVETSVGINQLCITIIN